MAWFFKFSQTVAWWCHLGSNPCKLHNGISRYLRAKASGCNVVLKLLMHIPVWKAHSWTVCPRIMYHYLGMEFCCCAIRSCQVAHIILYPHHIPAMSPFIHIKHIPKRYTLKEISMSRLTRTRPGCEHPLQVHQPKSPGHRVRGQKSLRPRL